jgi:phosphoglycolate phosphatase-like HAD superfamily hydrolase
MARAFADLYGVEDAFRRVEFSGRTDTAIFGDCLREHGVVADDLPAHTARFIDAYVAHLEAALKETEGRLMPGISGLLDVLSARSDVVMGLGTGNFRRGGEMKLRYYGLEGYFPRVDGGFGEDSESRDEVIRIGIERLRRDGASGATRVVVIGDTPHDVAAARANGAFALGVATGRDDVAELRACGADEALDDLSDVERVVSIICGG